MSSALDELRFYGTLAATLLGPRYDLARVPGPPGRPLLGNITAVMRPDYHVQMLEWANTYGGVFKFSLGFQPVVVVSDPAVAVQVLGRTPGRAIPRKCVGYKFFDMATNASGAHSFFTTSDEAQWAAVRKAAAAAFSSANVKKAFPIALRHLLLVAESLDPLGPQSPGNPYTELTHHSQHHQPTHQDHHHHQEQPQRSHEGGGKKQGRGSAAVADTSTGDGSVAGPSYPSSSSSNAAAAGAKGRTGPSGGSGDRSSSSSWLWRGPDLSWLRSDLSMGFRRRSHSSASKSGSAAVLESAAAVAADAAEAVGAADSTAAAAAAASAPSATSSYVDLGGCVGTGDSSLATSLSLSPSASSAAGVTSEHPAAAPCSCGRCGANTLRRGGGGSGGSGGPSGPAGPAVATGPAGALEGASKAAMELLAAAPAGPADSEAEAEQQQLQEEAAAGGGGGRAAIHSHPFYYGAEDDGDTSSAEDTPATHTAAAVAAEPGPRTPAAGTATAASAAALGGGSSGDGGSSDGGAGAGARRCCVVDIQEHLELSLLHVFVEALFGVAPQDFPGRQVAADMNLVLEEANSRLKVPLSGLARAVTQPVAQARIRAAQLRLAAVYGQLYDVIRARGPQPPAVTDLWACLGRVRHPKTGELLDRGGLVPEIGALMMAGFDTSSHSVAWALFALAANPGAQERVQQELDGRGLLRRPGTAAPPRLPDLDDLPQLPYLSACIDEAMRMYPVAATASVREVTEPTRVGDFVIPPGVIVWPMLYALHNSVHNWDRPDQFLPERWLQPPQQREAQEQSYDGTIGGGGSRGSNRSGGTGAAPVGDGCGSGRSVGGEVSDDEGGRPPLFGHGGGGARSGSSSSSRVNSRSSSASALDGDASPSATPAGGGGAKGGGGGKRYMPFSDGMKSCLGQALGLMEVRTALVVLLGRYSFSLDPGHGGAEAVRRSMIMSLTLKIRGGLRLVATPLG